MIAEIKSCNGKINTNFHNSKIPKEDFQFICLLVTLIDSSFRAGENYDRLIFLQECKHIIQEKKISYYITDDVENSDDENLEKIQIKKN